MDRNTVFDCRELSIGEKMAMKNTTVFHLFLNIFHLRLFLTIFHLCLFRNIFHDDGTVYVSSQVRRLGPLDLTH